MAQSAKVHMLHDWLIDNMEYKAKKRSAYDGLVLGKGDCFGYALAMDVLLRRAGFPGRQLVGKELIHRRAVARADVDHLVQLRISAAGLPLGHRLARHL